MFQLATQFRYGLRCLVALSLMTDNQPVTLRSLCEDQGVSKKYMEAIFRLLRGSGIIRSTRGSNGGYEMSRPPEEVTLLEVLNAVDGPVRLLDCTRDETLCDRVKRCPTRSTWKELEQNIDKFLRSKTVKDLADDFKCSRKVFGDKND